MKKQAAEKLTAGTGRESLARPTTFTRASGLKSSIYCDNRKVLSFRTYADFIKSELCNLVFETFPDEAAVIAGVATAGIPPYGAMVADQLKLLFIFVRSKAERTWHGQPDRRRIAEGQPVVVVEDLISTGKSSQEAVEPSVRLAAR